MRRPKKFPIRRCAAIDVDDTLIIGGELNQDVVDWIKVRRERGIELILWSARGKAYAQKTADHFKVSYLFDSIISKPGVVVDDKGWSWIKDTQVIRV